MSATTRRMFAVLDLFTESAGAWTAEAICERLGYTPSSGYRYIRDLCDAGLLARMTGGIYVLGPRIVELEYLMRDNSPVTRVARPHIVALAKKTGCHVMMSAVHGSHIINILHEPGIEKVAYTYLRGRPHPLFRGAQAKAILPFLPRSQLRRIYDANAAEVKRSGLGRDWPEFWAAMQAIRRLGHSESHGELDPGIGGYGCPIHDGERVIGSLSIGGSERRLKTLDTEAILRQLKRTAETIGAAIGELAAR